ncbi:MAG: geranylgeranylglycerol-phosphate geranylgeranyltransferase [Paludibacteraceae bacterium]|nr:geranylgeranylglycerol-phosphate geranylgeranyltransferase [Paludibacteraceae bacterium]
MYKYLSLIRYYNLIFIVFVQLVVRQTVLVPVLQKYGFEIVPLDAATFLLIAATVLIAAGGYVLNDYFDIKIDAINKPDKQIVNKTVSKTVAMRIYQALTAAGVVTGLASAHFSQSYTLAFIFVVVPGLLWFYSASYKRQFLTGNLTVAFMAALTVMVVAINEVKLLENEFGDLLFQTPLPSELYSWAAGFALFSFLLTLIREIVKDIEDINGDREMECRTIPIVWGIAKAKILIYVLIVITVAALFAANHLYISFEGTLTLRYLIFAIVLPLLALALMLLRPKNRESLHQASTLTKMVMVAGVSYGFIFYFLMAKTYQLSIFGLFMTNPNP